MLEEGYTGLGHLSQLMLKKSKEKIVGNFCNHFKMNRLKSIQNATLSLYSFRNAFLTTLQILLASWIAK